MGSEAAYGTHGQEKTSRAASLGYVGQGPTLAGRIIECMCFYQGKEVKNLLAYLGLLINPKDDSAMQRIINFPKRGTYY